jgi:hypothetical protein
MSRSRSVPASSWRGAIQPLLRRALLIHFCLLWSVGGCRQILGLEEAELDPGVASAGSDGSGGPEGSGASGGTESSAGAENGTGDAGSGADDASGGTKPSSGGTDSGSGATGGTMSTGDGGEGGTEEPPPPSLCQAYCNTMATNCTGDHAQYADMTTCLAVCHALPAGALGDSNKNTVHCRLAEAKKAAGGEPEFYCPFAGPGGGGACGDNCDGYCTLMMELCTSANTGGLYYYQSMGHCKQQCKTWPVAGTPYSPALHSSGNHFQCRLFHACSSIVDPDYHCGHAMGEPPCTDPETEE